jgi:monoamine oxidase
VLASQQAEARLLDLQLGPRVAIVGGGIAGLNAAYRLRQRGIRAQVYEAADRVGGRMHTVRNVLAQGLTTEFGGEFIDSGHKEMLDLARRFHLELIDTQGRSERGLIPEAYLFNGRRGINEVVEAFRPLAQQIQADYDGTSEIVDYAHHSPFDVELDRLSIAEYLDRIGAAGPIRELLAVAYLTEYGLEIERQSALNLVYLIGTDTTGPQGAPRFEVFGESDERYKIRGGNDLLTRRMGKALREQIHLGHWLEAVTQSGRGYRLTFSRPNSSVEEVDADFVILCIPFSILRSVRFQPELPPIKRRAIQELAYGTNSKLIVGLRSRVWREQGYGGNIFTNVGFQSGWDSSRGQKPRDGSFTFYTGGNLGVELGNGTPEAWAQRFMPGLEQAFPGVIAAQNGNVLREHWPSNPLTLGSYAAYEPGHWTTIAGAEGVPVGNLFFAGEHCSYDYQGYMNGGAVTGRQAARAVLRKMAQLSG